MDWCSIPLQVVTTTRPLLVSKEITFLCGEEQPIIHKIHLKRVSLVLVLRSALHEEHHLGRVKVGVGKVAARLIQSLVGHLAEFEDFFMLDDCCLREHCIHEIPLV